MIFLIIIFTVYCLLQAFLGRIERDNTHCNTVGGVWISFAPPLPVFVNISIRLLARFGSRSVYLQVEVVELRGVEGSEEDPDRSVEIVGTYY